jgi:hypothetical protein
MKRSSVELELFRNLFISIAEEMGAVLRKTSYSANIKERRDYSCAITTRPAKQWRWATTNRRRNGSGSGRAGGKRHLTDLKILQK